MSFMGMGCLGSDPNEPFFNGRKIRSKNDLSSIWTHLRKYIFKAEVIASWDMHEEPLTEQHIDLFLSFPNCLPAGSDVRCYSCDELPGAHGPFGLTPGNPIPVNGIRGLFSYLNRLRTSDTGAGYLYHKIDVASSEMTTLPLERYELMAIDASVSNVLYFSTLHARRSTLVPSGNTLIPWNRMDQEGRILCKLPCFGINEYVHDFPYGLADAIHRNSGLINFTSMEFADVISVMVREIVNKKTGKWEALR